MMPDIANGITLDQLRAATKAQIVARIDTWLANHTKRQICEMLLELVEVQEELLRTYRADGQVVRQLERRTDVLGAKTGSRETTWTYYPTGEVDTITVVERDAADAATRTRTVRHFLDGRQPVLTET